MPSVDCVLACLWTLYIVLSSGYIMVKATLNLCGLWRFYGLYTHISCSPLGISWRRVLLNGVGL